MSDLRWSTGTDIPIVSHALAAAGGFAFWIGAAWWRQRRLRGQRPGATSRRGSSWRVGLLRVMVHRPSHSRVPRPRGASDEEVTR